MLVMLTDIVTRFRKSEEYEFIHILRNIVFFFFNFLFCIGV